LLRIVSHQSPPWIKAAAIAMLLALLGHAWLPAAHAASVDRAPASDVEHEHSHDHDAPDHHHDDPASCDTCHELTLAKVVSGTPISAHALLGTMPVGLADEPVVAIPSAPALRVAAARGPPARA